MTPQGFSYSRQATGATEQLLRSLDAGPALACTALSFTGEAPPLATRHQIVGAQAAVLASFAALVVERWHDATGTRQRVAIDAVQAACSLNPLHFQLQHGHRVAPSLIIRELKSAFYRTADGKWFYPCGSYPHLRDGSLDILKCANSSSAIAQAISGWPAQELELAFQNAGLAGAYVRTAREWRSHPQGATLSSAPLVTIEKIGESAPEPASCRRRPLDDLRVLDLAHVIAGPVVSRTLAEHGADVLRITQPGRPDILPLIMDTCIGKRSCNIDLHQPADAARVLDLVEGADVVVQSWRPGALDRWGLGHADVARHRPGIIYVSVSCFGFDGPWSHRKGFEQLAQAVSGIAATEGGDEPPREVPTHLLNDYMTGYLGAAGVLAALRRRASEGGSYHVKVSLARTSMWIQDLGLQIPPTEPQPFDALRPMLETRESPFGLLTQLPPVAQFSGTPAHWSVPPSPLGAHAPHWAS